MINMNNQETSFINQFEEFTDKEIATAKNELNKVTPTGTISNYSERLNIFNINLKKLNDTFVSNANSILDNTNTNDNDLKEKLFEIAKGKIENFIEFFNN